MRNAKFNGKTLSEFGFYLADSNFMDGAAKNVETIYVPGRSGLLQRFNNYENVKLWANVYCLSNMQQNMTALRTFLESCIGYQRYEDDFNPDEYRMASFKEMFTPGTVDVNGGVVRLVFDAMPQRFLKSGETATDATPSSTTSSGSTVSVPNPSGLSSVSDLKVSIEPVQDLHGQDAPYPGGGGKNKLPPVAVGSTSTNGITFTVNSDGTITANGTATANASLILLNNEQLIPTSESVVFNGCPSGGSATTYRVFLRESDGASYKYDTGNGQTLKGVYRIVITIYSGQTANNLVFKPMIRLASVADDSFAPYSNICPITGHTQAVVYRVGKNLLPNNWVQRTTNGVTFTPQPNGRVRVYGTATDYTIYSDSFVWTGDTGVYYFNGCPDGSATTYDTFIYDSDTGQRARKGDGVTPCDSCYSRSQEVLLAKGTRYLYVIRVFAGQTMTQQLFAPMIRRSADDAYYDAYQGAEFAVDLNGTIYGGTLDVTHGVLTVDRGYTTVSALTWTYDSTYTRFSTRITNLKTGLPTRGVPLLSSAFVTIDDGRAISAVPDNAIYGAGAPNYVYIKTSLYTSASGFVNALGDTQIVYPLATPQTVQLTPTQISLLQGSNYINASTGDVEITVSTPGMLLNPTLFESKPIIRMYGNGTVNIGNATITVANSPFDFVDLDCETMDAHYGSGNANPYVSLSTDDFITLKPGENYVTYSGFTVVRITPRWYEI